jgi:predicted RNase H-like HicB family nuclease
MIRTDDLRAHRDEPASVELKVEPLFGQPSQPGDRQLPDQLIARYVERAMLRAEVKQYPDGTWFAEIPRFAGVWANQPTEEATLEELKETLHEWVLLKIQDRDRDLPEVDGINLNVL